MGCLLLLVLLALCLEGCLFFLASLLLLLLLCICSVICNLCCTLFCCSLFSCSCVTCCVGRLIPRNQVVFMYSYKLVFGRYFFTQVSSFEFIILISTVHKSYKLAFLFIRLFLFLDSYMGKSCLLRLRQSYILRCLLKCMSLPYCIPYVLIARYSSEFCF